MIMIQINENDKTINFSSKRIMVSRHYYNTYLKHVSSLQNLQIYHRKTGPAISGQNSGQSDGYDQWFVNGLRHRKYGPAVMFLHEQNFPKGKKDIEWFFENLSLTEDKYWNI